MSDTSTAGLRAWLISDTPESRRQARLGQLYRQWLAFKRNPMAVAGLAIVILLLLVAALAPVIAPFNPIAQALDKRLLPPSSTNWFGTDALGRDIFSRIVYGTRITLVIVLLVVVTVGPFGLLIGAVSGYFGGWVDRLLMRITDVFLAFPRLVLALAFVAALGPGIVNAIIAIAITTWPPVPPPMPPSVIVPAQSVKELPKPRVSVLAPSATVPSAAPLSWMTRAPVSACEISKTVPLPTTRLPAPIVPAPARASVPPAITVRLA